MNQQPPAPPPTPAQSAKVIPLHQQAEANLAYIRNTMAASTLFTGVSGKGMVLIGISALLTVWLTEFPAGASSDNWVMVWLLEACCAVAISLYCMGQKTRLQGQSLWSASGRRLLFALVPALGAGALLTLLFMQPPLPGLLPPMWLLLYGAAVTTAGTHSIALIPIMGIAFMSTGALAGLNVHLGMPLPSWLFMAGGFGGLHLLFGTIIWRQHGG